eukprot:11595753-Ditylum_brightwellii.AAC.1
MKRLTSCILLGITFWSSQTCTIDAFQCSSCRTLLNTESTKQLLLSSSKQRTTSCYYSSSDSDDDDDDIREEDDERVRRVMEKVKLLDLEELLEELDERDVRYRATSSKRQLQSLLA